MSIKVPLSRPDITEAEIEAVTDVLRTPNLSLGPKLGEFERAFCHYTGRKYAVAVNSGTSGLYLCLQAMGIGPGDEVISTPFTFIATTNVILMVGAKPVLVDIDPDTLNIDPKAIEKAITPKTKAIIPVEAFGSPAGFDHIYEIAKKHHLLILEDSCEGLGSMLNGKKVGTFGDMSVFAFYPNKQMTTGEGGMIVTNDDDWAALFRSLRNQGRDVFDAWLNHTRLGYNYRLDEMSAALGLSQIGRLNELLAKREQVAGWYNERLHDEELIEIPQIVAATTRMSWFVYVVRIKPPAQRDAVMKHLAEAGIPSRPYFTPIHLQPFYREKFGYQRGDFPVTEYLGDVSLALPFSGVMTEDQVDYVCERLRSATRPAVSH